MKTTSLLSILMVLFVTCVAHISPAFAADRLTCESEKGRRQYCDVGGARDADIELSRQLSDARCERGESWGRNDHGVWVDNGCRAEFTVYRRQEGYDSRPDYNHRDPAPAREQCPPGFEPGNHRCTQEERRRGCKDMRMPGGTTCSSRGWGY
jgi:Protein of unknown function (DUF3011)